LIIFSTFFPMYSDNLRNKVFVSSSVRGLMVQRLSQKNKKEAGQCV
jgi:hypothetical protein